MYGMTEKEFWHSDMRLLDAYRKAFIRKTSYVAWLSGYYNNVGFEIGLSNLMAKKGQPRAKFPKFNDPIEHEKKPKITEENIEFEFRKQQAKQQSWFHDLIHKK